MYGYRHFTTDTAQERYILNRDKRTILPMKAYNLGHPQVTELRERLFSMNWQKLLVPEKEINRTVVNEFYACVYAELKDKGKFHTDPESVQVRGVEVEFGPDTIRSLLEIPHDGTDTSCLIDDDLSGLRGVISDSDTPVVWTKRTGPRKDKCMKIGILTAQMQVLNKIIHSNLLPSVRSHEIGPDRIDVLYRVAAGIPVSVGLLIHQTICKCAMAGKNSLVLPQLVTALCYRAGVPVEENDSIPRLNNASLTWCWSDPAAEPVRTVTPSRPSIKKSGHRKTDSDSADASSDSGDASAGATPEFVFAPREDASTSQRPRCGRFERFFERIKEHITEALSGICAKIDVVDSESRARDMVLQATVRENEAHRRADVEYQKHRDAETARQIAEMREDIRAVHAAVIDTRPHQNPTSGTSMCAGLCAPHKPAHRHNFIFTPTYGLLFLTYTCIAGMPETTSHFQYVPVDLRPAPPLSQFRPPRPLPLAMDTEGALPSTRTHARKKTATRKGKRRLDADIPQGAGDAAEGNEENA